MVWRGYSGQQFSHWREVLHDDLFEERLKEALADEELSDGIEQAQDLGVVAVPGESLTI